MNLTWDGTAYDEMRCFGRPARSGENLNITSILLKYAYFRLTIKYKIVWVVTRLNSADICPGMTEGPNPH